MSKLENNPAIGMSWEEFENEYCTPEQIAVSKLNAALIGALCDARDEGKITVKELEDIEDIEDQELWLGTVLKTLFSFGKTIAIVPMEQNKAS